MFKTVEEPEHRQQLRESVIDFIRREVDGRGIREGAASEGGFSADRWRTIAELGWIALLVPEDFGGLGLELGDAVALHHELGRGALTEPLIPVGALGARALVLGDNVELKKKILPRLVSGDMLATLAWQDGEGAKGAGEVGPTAQRNGNGWTLSGKADFVPLAPVADGFVVAARCDDGILLGWLDDRDALEIEAAEMADGSKLGHVRLKDAALPEDAVVAPPAEGARLLEEALDTGRMTICAELLGAMEQLLEMTLEYLRQRVQFDKPIGSFQVLQHRAVDLYTHIEMSRSALLRAVAAHENGAEGTRKAAETSAAKSRCADAALFVIKQSIQMHGAIAYTEEFDLSLYIRRVLHLAAFLGNSATHRGRYAELTGLSGAN